MKSPYIDNVIQNSTVLPKVINPQSNMADFNKTNGVCGSNDCIGRSLTLLPKVYGLGFRFGEFVSETAVTLQTSWRSSSTLSSPLNIHDFYDTAGALNNTLENSTFKPSIPSKSSISSTSFTSLGTSVSSSYQRWWMQLYSNDPTHVYVETTLLLAIVYFILASRRSSKKYWNDRQKEKLTVAEEEELIMEWKDHIRQPLAPPLPPLRHPTLPSTTATSFSNEHYNIQNTPPHLFADHTALSQVSQNDVHNNVDMNPPFIGGASVIVHKNNGRLLDVELMYQQNRYHHSQSLSSITCPPKTRKTVLNFATFDFLGMASDNPIELCGQSSTDLNGQEEILTSTAISHNYECSVKKSSDDTRNLSNNSSEVGDKGDALSKGIKPYLRKYSHERSIVSVSSVHEIRNPIKKAALQALDRYGCGSCGPRGFYGTIDVHLQLEERFAEYIESDNAILYSDAASTCSSTIASFCKRGDLLVVDEACYEPIMTGVLLSRANVKMFKHNDMTDLEAVLKKVHDSDSKLGRKPNSQRRFLVVEGLYKNTGAVCPLDVVVALKHKYHYRLILDESHSFGTLGATGKGALELYNKRLMCDAEIVTVSMENAVGSIGGMTVGTDEVVDHQRLSGVGYCFSASTPPFTAAAAIAAIDLMEKHNRGLVQRLGSNRKYFYEHLQHVLHHEMEDVLFITSDIRSPIVMLQCNNTSRLGLRILDQITFIEQVVRECLSHQKIAFVAVTTTSGKPVNIIHKSNNSGMTSSTDTSSASKTPKLSNCTTSTKDDTRQPLAVPARIRISITASQTHADLEHAISALHDAVDIVLEKMLAHHK